MPFDRRVQRRLRFRVATTAGAMLAGVATLALIALITWVLLPPLDISRYQTLSPVVTARDGEVLNVFLAADERWRIHTSPENVSPRYIHSLLLIEDQHFYRHPGVNPLALIRAAGQWLRYGQIVSGGSTITMQVARLLEPKPRTIKNKWIEIVRALELEYHWSKDEILAMYLTLVPMGGNLESIQAASLRYLGTDPRHLSLADVSVLLAIPQSPERRRPDRHSDNTRQAALHIADRLIQHGLFSPQDKDEIDLLPLDEIVQFPNHSWHLSRRLANVEANGSNGWVVSTLDYSLQRTLEDKAWAMKYALSSKQNVAAMVLHAPSGEVLAHLGSLGLDSASGYMDLTTAVRSPGSVLKPFIYGMAMDDGLITDQTILWDRPTRFGRYVPTNFELGHQGPVRVGTALQASLNVPAVQVLEELGPRLFLDAWDQAGLDYWLPAGATPNVAIALGAIGMRLSDLVQAYGALALHQEGTIPLMRTLREQGTSEVGEGVAQTQMSRLLTPETARVLHAILAAAPMVDGRMHRALAGGAVPAFKTGTSYGYRDAWAVGAIGSYVVGVWVGRPDGAPVTGATGRSSALRLAMALADQLPVKERPSLWAPLPLDLLTTAKAPQIVSPEPGADLVLTEPPHPERSIALQLSGSQYKTMLRVNGKNLAVDDRIPVPYNGGYHIELYEDHVLRHSVEINVMSPVTEQ